MCAAENIQLIYYNNNISFGYNSAGLHCLSALGDRDGMGWLALSRGVPALWADPTPQ